MTAKEETIAHYDKLIDEGNDPVRDPPPLREYMNRWDGDAFIGELRLSPEKAALEIGVGTGRLAVRTAPLCKRLVGIDFSPKTFGRARLNLAAFANVSLVCGDFLEHDFAERFDVVYSSLTFMHIEEKEAAIRKAAQLLRPRGRLVLSLDKNKSDFINMGTRKVRIFPDSAERTCEFMRRAGLAARVAFETDAAEIVVGKIITTGKAGGLTFAL